MKSIKKTIEDKLVRPAFDGIYANVSTKELNVFPYRLGVVNGILWILRDSLRSTH